MEPMRDLFPHPISDKTTETERFAPEGGACNSSLQRTGPFRLFGVRPSSTFQPEENSQVLPLERKNRDDRA